jgi:hypothetical protein
MAIDIDKDFQMRVLMDDKSIAAGNEYAPDEIHETLDKKFESVGYVKGRNGWYYGSKGNKNYAFGLGMGSYLEKQAWFRKYAKVWVWRMAELLAKNGWIEENWLNE